MTPVGCYHYSGPCVDFIRVDYGNEVYMYIVFIFSTNVSKLQAILDADARLIGASQSLPMTLLSSETYSTGFPFASPSKSRYVPS